MKLKMEQLVSYLTSDKVKPKSILIESDYECMVALEIIIQDVETGCDLRFYSNSFDFFNAIDLEIDLTKLYWFRLSKGFKNLDITLIPENLLRMIMKFKNDGFLDITGDIILIKDKFE